MTPLTKTLYTTGEVCEIVGISANTLYRWIREFRQLSPKAGPGRYKRYTKADVELCQLIREQICDKGLSTAATRDFLDQTYRKDERRRKFVCSDSDKAVKLLSEAMAMSAGNSHVVQRLKAVMEWISTLDPTAQSP